MIPAKKYLINVLQLNLIVWVVTAVAVALAIVVWGQSLDWHVWGTSTYLLFPVFGLLVFSVLWSQYMAIVLRSFLKADKTVLKNYFSVTGYVVLAGILLHPGLLIWQLWRDGAGLPPGSYEHYVLPSLKGFVILGSINVTILLLFELRRVFAAKPWWRYATYVVDLAMFSIFIHGLKLGTQLQSGWYRKVWFFYGITLLLALVYIYVKRFAARSKQHH